MPEEFIEDIIAESSEQPENFAAPNDDSSNQDIINNQDENLPISEKTTEEDIKSVEDPSNDGVAHKDTVPKTEPTIEELATQIGWRPDYDGENSVDAATYILKSREIQDSMKDHNKDLKNQLNNLQGSIDSLKEHNQRVYQAEVKRLQGELNNLKKEKKEAIELADVDKVTELDEKINSLQQDLNEPLPEQKPTGNPLFDDWVKDNQWYLNDDDMAQYADSVAQQYQGAPADRIYAIVRNKVAEVFPEKFETPSTSVKPKPTGPTSPVEAPKKSGGTPKFTKTNLSPEQINIMNQFVRGGIMTEDQYINDIAKLQGE